MGTRNECDVKIFGEKPALSEKEIARIKDQVTDLVREARRNGEDISKSLTNFFEKRKIEIRTNQKRIAVTAQRYKALKEQLFGGQYDDPVTAIESFLHHNSKTKDGTGTIYRRKQVLQDEHLAPLSRVFEKYPGSRQRFEKGDMRGNLMKLLHGDKVPDSQVDEATEAVFKAMRGILDSLWERKNQAGYSVNYVKNYAGKQVHPVKNLLKLGRTPDEAKKNWISLAMEVFDLKDIAGGDPRLLAKGDILSLEGKLSESFDNLITKGDPFVVSDDLTTILTGGGKSIEKSRKFKFKNGDAAIKYYDAMGIDFEEQFIKDIHADSSKIAAAEILGPNHSSTFAKLMRDAEISVRGDEKKHKKFLAKKDFLEAMYERSTGGLRQESLNLLAYVGDKFRKFTDITHLSTALASTVSDFGFGAGIRNVLTGENFFTGTAKIVDSTFRNFVSKQHSRDVANKLGIFLDDVIVQGTDARFGETGSTVSGVFDRAHQAIMNITGLHRQSISFRRAFAKLMTNDIHEFRNLSFDSLQPGLKQKLQSFNMGPAEWNIIKEISDTDFGDGTRGITPENIAKASLDFFEGKTLTEKRASRSRMRNDYASFLQEMAELGSPTPGLKQHTFKNLYNPNTIQGQAWLSAMQYKSFALSIFDTLATIKNTGDHGKYGNIRAISATVVTSTVLGYMSLAMKDALKGRDIRDPRDPKSIVDAFLHGGAGTIYSDFIFTDYSKSYRNPILDLAGPLAGQVSDASEILSGILRGKDVDKKSSRFLRNNVLPKVPIAGHLLNEKIFEIMNETLNGI